MKTAGKPHDSVHKSLLKLPQENRKEHVNQSDLQRTNERNGILDFQRILEGMDEFSMVEFGINDIVRSGLVKSYLISKMTLGL